MREDFRENSDFSFEGDSQTGGLVRTEVRPETAQERFDRELAQRLDVLAQSPEGTQDLVYSTDDKGGKRLTVYRRAARGVIVAEEGAVGEKNRKQGLWKIYNEGGVLEEKRNYLNDKLHGLQRRYNGRGNVVGRAMFYKGQQKGLAQDYDATGELAALTYFSENKEKMTAPNVAATKKLNEALADTRNPHKCNIIQNVVLFADHRPPSVRNENRLDIILKKFPDYQPMAQPFKTPRKALKS